MNDLAHIPPPLQDAARQGAAIHLTDADSDSVPRFRAAVISCDPGPARPPTLRLRLPKDTPPLLLHFGDFLEARFPLNDHLYVFDTIVLELARSPAPTTLWTTLPQDVEILRRRRHRRVQPRQPLQLSVRLASERDPLSAIASSGPGFLHRGLLRNISEGGLNAIFPPGILTRMSIGQEISVSLRLPGDVEEAILDASIVYLRKRKKNRTVSCGVQFSIPPDHLHIQRSIADFVLRERKNHAAADACLRFW